MSLNPSIMIREQARLLFQASTTSGMTNIFVSICFYFIFRDIVDHRLLTLACLAIATLSATRILLSKQYAKRNPDDVTYWLKLFTFTTLLIGISWACFSLFYLSTDDANIKALFIILICGVMSAAVPILSAWTPAYYAMTLPPFLTLFSIFIYQNDTYSYFLAACFLLYYLMLISLQRNTNQNVKKSFQLEHKNDELVSKLSQEIEQREQLIAERTHELNDNLKRLDFALGTTQQGWFDLNFQTGEILVSNEYPRLLGYEPSEFNSSFEEWKNSIHPEEQASVLTDFQDSLKVGRSKEIIYRRKAKNGHWLWFHSIGEVIEWDAHNKPLRMVGIHRDITDQKLAEQALMISETKFHTLFDSTTDAVMILAGIEGKFNDANEATLNLFGSPSLENFCTMTVADISPDEQPCGISSITLAQQHISTALKLGHYNFDWIHKRVDNGECFPADVLLSTLTINGDDMIQATVRDITERKKTEEKLSLMAHFDSLTKLPNRVLFSDRFNQAIAHSKRTKSMLAICFIDIDNFKPVNDDFGHGIGDKLLIEIARRISINIRVEDTASRQGGDEFTLLLRDIESLNQCKRLLNRIHTALNQPYLIDEHSHHISASIGVTIYPEDNSDLDILLRHADQAMYQAKLAGKNQIKFFELNK